MVLLCSPTPTVQWIKMGVKLPSRTKLSNFQKLLTITSVDETDEGKYMCKASNSAGHAVHYFDVIVEGRSTSGTNYEDMRGCVCFCFRGCWHSDDSCFDSDQHGSPLRLPEPPKWLTEPPQSQLTVIGSDVHIKCSVSGKPPPDITWRRNGEFLQGEW